MAFLLKSIHRFYNYIYYDLEGKTLILFNNNSNKLSFLDPRMVKFPLLQNSPLPIISILGLYALLCIYGPILMKSRKAFTLKSVMMFYNAAQIILCFCFASKVEVFNAYINLTL